MFARLAVEESLGMGGFFAEPNAFGEQQKRVLQLFPRLKGTLPPARWHPVRRRAADARALMSQPRLRLDEPSLGLAPIVIQQIFAIVERLRREGVTILLVEQNANQAPRLADRGYVLENGQIVLHGSGVALPANPDVHRAYLGG